MFAVPETAVRRIHASSGTTGRPTVVGYTENDLGIWAAVVARSIRAAGGRPGDRLHNAYGYGLFTGGLGAHYGAERLGCTSWEAEVKTKGRLVLDCVVRDLAASAGLKLHPAYDDYPADTAALDPYLKIAAEAGVPVTVHSSPGPADPDLIARLAERFPAVPFVLYHTFLGPPEGRQRAARHAKRLTNVHLETSWCASDAVERLLDEVGPDRVLFGSDAATDGPSHFVRRPPNIEMRENYNGSLLRLAKRLKPAVTRNLLEDNARKLFGLKP
jgi:hypothetical protein